MRPRTMSESITSFIPRAAGFASSSDAAGWAKASGASSRSVLVVAAVVVGLPAMSSPSAGQASNDEAEAAERLRL